MSARNSLNELCSVLDASPTAITRDWWRGLGPKGDWAIRGKFGHIYEDGGGYLLCVVSERLSTRRWNAIKEELGFCKLTQDGDSEGCLHLGRLPSSAEAELIRSALGIRKRRRVNPGIIGRPFAKSGVADVLPSASSPDASSTNASPLPAPMTAAELIEIINRLRRPALSVPNERAILRPPPQ